MKLIEYYVLLYIVNTMYPNIRDLLTIYYVDSVMVNETRIQFLIYTDLNLLNGLHILAIMIK